MTRLSLDKYVRLHETKIVVAVIVVSALFALYSLYFFMDNKVYLIGSDTFYYLSIGDNLAENGEFSPTTTEPPRNIKTPQNGITIIYALFNKLGVDPESGFRTISVINWLLLMSTIYPVYRIARRVGLQDRLGLAALLAAFIGGWHIYRFQMIPYNDGMFNAAAIWLTFLIISKIGSLPTLRELKSVSFTRGSMAAAIGLVLLAAITVHFRLNSLFVVASAGLAFLLVRRMKETAWLALLGAVTVLSVGITYALVDRSGFSGQSEPTDIISNIPLLFRDTLPVLLVGRDFSPLLMLLVAPFVIGVALMLRDGYRRSEPVKIFLMVSTIVAIAFLTLFSNVQIPRMLIYIYPFLWIAVLHPRVLRPIGIALAGLVLLSSAEFFYSGFDRFEGSDFWLYVNENPVQLEGDDPLLLSPNERHPYYFLDAKTYIGELSWDLVETREDVYIVGSEDYRTGEIESLQDLAANAGGTITASDYLPDYSDRFGWTITRVRSGPTP